MGPKKGFYGEFGGCFVPEILIQPLLELEKAFFQARRDKLFWQELNYYWKNYCNRPTALYLAKNLSAEVQAKVYLKREDLNPTGAHKITNCLGQAILARRMGKKKLLAETGAGQHGVAVATVAAIFGMDCRIYMGKVDYRRQEINVKKMQLLNAEVISVENGSATLKDATSEALRDWATNLKDTYYLLGSAVGPHPYPFIVRELQRIIGQEVKRQILNAEKKLPDYLVAAVGGGSNAIGLFYPFIHQKKVKLIGIEAGGKKGSAGAASLQRGSIGVFHGARTYLLQNKQGQVVDTNSISAGLDYPAVGPELSWLFHSGRMKAELVSDTEARAAFLKTIELEGIIPALESAHAISWVLQRKIPSGSLIVINLSGRGEKDLDQILREDKNATIACAV